MVQDITPLRLSSRPPPIEAQPVQEDPWPPWVRGVVAVALMGGALFAIVKVAEIQERGH